jgi:hypothetical protein
MAIKVLSSGGNGSPAQSISGINFAVQQGCDIFSMSLGWWYSAISSTEKAQLRAACVNALAAGVIGAVAAGNEGQYGGGYAVPNNVRTPGSCPPPWLHPAQTLTGGLSCVVTCGATQSDHQIASFSSRGPVTWSSISPYFDYAYNPGMGLMDPDVAAPGVDVKSCAWNNNTGYLWGPNWSGTSMATPHVAGTLALMLDKNASLTPRQLDSLLELTSLDWGAAGKDNTYGAGRIDAAAAVLATPGGAPPNVSIDLVPTGPTSLPSSGGTLLFNVTINNNEAFTISVQGWLEWTYPSGSSSGPLLVRYIVLGAGGSLFRSLTQTVAGSEPNGNYTYWGRLGPFYGGTPYAQDSFAFSKGLSGIIGPWEGESQTSGWEEEQPVVAAQVPQEYSLGQNYPNPFNPSTTFSFSLPADGHVALKVYDLQGKEVGLVVEGDMAAGQYQAVFNGSHLSSGVYLYRLEAGSYQANGKMVLMK